MHDAYSASRVVFTRMAVPCGSWNPRIRSRSSKAKCNPDSQRVSVHQRLRSRTVEPTAAAAQCLLLEASRTKWKLKFERTQ